MKAGERLEPLGERVLIRADEAEETTGTLYIPEQARVLPVFGTIAGTGPLVQSLAIGDRVVFGKYSGTEIPLDIRGKDKLIVMFEHEVLCKAVV